VAVRHQVYAADGGPGAVDESREARRERYAAGHLPKLRATFEHAFGARLLIANRVLREAATSDEHGPGASYAGGYRSQAQVMALEELWFDNAAWAEEFFAHDAVLGLLRDSALGRVEGYRVVESIGVDKRAPA
jgi:hypothetical protein